MLPRRYLLTASRVTPFIELLYVVLVDKIQGDGGKPDEATSLEINTLATKVLRVWDAAVPSLRGVLLQILKGKNKADAYAQLGAILKALVPEGKSDTEVPIADLDIMKTLGAYFRTDSPNALAKLTKFASLTRSPWVVQRLAPKVGAQADTKAELEKLVNNLVGRKDTALTLEEGGRVKAINPEDYTKYLALRKVFNQSWRDALVSFIRKSGKSKVLYKDALAYLKLNGIDHLMPTGFTGMIDDLSRLYTNSGKSIDGVPNAVMFPSVVMNPTYGKPEGGDWVFQARRSDGTPGPYFYTSDFKKSQSLSKFSKVDALSKKMPQMRKKWFAQVRAFDITHPTCVTAVVLEILYEFAARIGSIGNKAAGQATYGVATLLVRHAVIDPSGNITLRYKGKKGIPTVHKVLKSDPYAKYVLLALHQLLANKDPKERIFTYEKAGKHVPITSMMVNAFFKACGAPPDVTVHKIRTYMGTTLFNELMEEQFAKDKQPQSERDAMLIFKTMAEKVGKRLNHIRTGATGTKVTGTTALSAYIDVSAQLLFWHTLQIRVPKYLEKFSDELGRNDD